MSTDKAESQRLADAPERIWLQVCDDAGCVESFSEHDGVTWCQHRINDSDIEYVRADRIAALEAALAERDEVLEIARQALESHMAQTRVIQRSVDALRAIEGVLR